MEALERMLVYRGIGPDHRLIKSALSSSLWLTKIIGRDHSGNQLAPGLYTTVAGESGNE